MLSVEQLCFRFPSRTILDRVSFALPPGTITCLLGGNGAGKTTLLNLLSGFTQPQAGEMFVGKERLRGRAPYRISRLGVARTFQDLRIIGKLSVRENILLAIPRHPGERLGRALLPRSIHRARDDADHGKAEALLADYFLAEVAEQSAAEISYGQQKLLTLACCAALESRLLLLDEPVAGISPEYRERIAGRLAILKLTGVTILLIEHQPDFLAAIGDQYLFLQSGKIHRFETFVELRAAALARESLN